MGIEETCSFLAGNFKISNGISNLICLVKRNWQILTEVIENSFFPLIYLFPYNLMVCHDISSQSSSFFSSKYLTYSKAPMLTSQNLGHKATSLNITSLLS